MALPAQTSRHDLIKRFRALGWSGPTSGPDHEWMVKGSRKVKIPNRHRADIGRDLLKLILQQAGIDPNEW